MGDVSRIDLNCDLPVEEGDQPGSLRFGPIRRMSRTALGGLLRENGLTTGNDTGAELRVVEKDRMFVEIRGQGLAGYFLELGGHGIEACEEDIEAFLLAAGHMGDVVSLEGRSDTISSATVVSKAVYQLGHRSVRAATSRRLTQRGSDVVIGATGGLVVIEGGRTPSEPVCSTHCHCFGAVV